MWLGGSEKWGEVRPSECDLHLSVPESGVGWGGWGGTQGGREEGTKEEVGGREVEKERSGAMLSHLPTRPRAGPLGAMSRVEGLRKPWGGLEGGFEAGVRRSRRPEENLQKERQTVQSPIK